jgi:hypothetical protein
MSSSIQPRSLAAPSNSNRVQRVEIAALGFSSIALGLKGLYGDITEWRKSARVATTILAQTSVVVPVKALEDKEIHTLTSDQRDQTTVREKATTYQQEGFLNVGHFLPKGAVLCEDKPKQKATRTEISKQMTSIAFHVAQVGLGVAAVNVSRK